MRGLLFFAAILAITGCQATPQSVRQPSSKPDYSALDKSKQPGQSEINGQAILRQRGGGIVTCAGNDVQLILYSEYMREIFTSVRYNGNIDVSGFNAIASKYSRKTNCDALGKFKFSKIPEGEFLVLTKVQWTVLNNSQGGALYKVIKVGKKDSIEVSLGNSDMM